jgi:hypothetical protein
MMPFWQNLGEWGGRVTGHCRFSTDLYDRHVMLINANAMQLPIRVHSRVREPRDVLFRYEVSRSCEQTKSDGR